MSPIQRLSDKKISTVNIVETLADEKSDTNSSTENRTAQITTQKHRSNNAYSNKEVVNNLNKKKSDLIFNEKNELALKDDSKPLVVKIPSIFQNKNVLPKNKVEKGSASLVTRLSLKEHSLSQNNQSLHTKNIMFNIIPEQSKKWHYEFSTGYSSWNLRLNQAFSKSLKSVNFNHKSGKGFYVSASMQKKLNSKTTFKASLQYEQIALQSNQNENVLYNNRNPINTFPVTIASPIGFINSNLAIKNTNDLLEEITELKLDIHNKQQIFAVDAGVSLSAKFIEFVKLSGETVFLSGIQQVLFVEDRLQSIHTNTLNFEPSNSAPLHRQNQPQNLIPYIGLGLQFDYTINTSQALRFQCLFKQSVLPIYKEADFKSFLNRQQVGLAYVVRF